MVLTKGKKIGAAVVSLALVASLGIGATLAYLTDKDERANTFTIGNVKIQLLEDKFDELSSGKPVDMEPGMIQAKDPVVKNTGSNPAYVRLKVDIPTYGENIALFEIGYEKDNAFVPGFPDYSGVKWVLEGEYYYLQTASGSAYELPAGQKSPELFTHIRLNPNVKEGDVVPGANDVGKAKKEVVVTAQAIQTGSFANANAAWASFDDQNPNVG